MTRRYLAGLAVLVGLLLLGRQFRLFRVSGLSMEPVLRDGAIVLANQVAYRGRRLPRAGDVVVCRDPRHLDRYLVKRLAATPGDTVRSVGGNDPLAGSPATVPSGHYVVVGDNSWFSRDSRTWGFLPAGHILGKAMLLRGQRPRRPGRDTGVTTGAVK